MPRTNIGEAQYLRLTFDRRMTFRVKELNAQKVELDLGELDAAERQSPHDFAPLLFEGEALR